MFSVLWKNEQRKLLFVCSFKKQGKGTVLLGDYSVHFYFLDDYSSKVILYWRIIRTTAVVVAVVGGGWNLVTTVSLGERLHLLCNYLTGETLVTQQVTVLLGYYSSSSTTALLQFILSQLLF